MSFDALIAWASTIKYFIDFAVLKIVFIKSMKWIHWGYLSYGFNILVVKHKKSINSQNRLNSRNYLNSQNCLNSQKFLNSQNHICFVNFFSNSFVFQLNLSTERKKKFPMDSIDYMHYPWSHHDLIFNCNFIFFDQISTFSLEFMNLNENQSLVKVLKDF